MPVRVWRVFLLLIVLVPSVAWGQSSVQYVYDDLGRLIGVTDPNGDTAVYHYDAVGNLVSIDRYPSSQVSIIAFTPGAAPTGTTVTISGTGFSATASQNTVTFNGAAAAVSTATPTQLVVVVPGTATTGAIGVTSRNGSATSARMFTVTSSSLAPTVTGFTPTAGPAATALGIDGTNFDPNAANDRIVLNVTPLGTGTASSSHLSTTVPTTVSSGRITVSTAYGSATTTSDFWVAPPGSSAANLEVKTRMAGFGDANTVTATITTAGNVGLVLFDAAGGHRVSTKISNVSFSNATVAVLSPFGSTLASTTTSGASAAFLEPAAVSASGPYTYTVYVQPVGSATGHASLTVYDVPTDITGTITPGGTPVTVTTTAPGQNASLTFSGTAGQRISLLGTNGISGQIAIYCDVNVSITNPDRTALVGPSCMEGSGYIDLTTLGQTGTYTILVDPYNVATGSLTLTLNSVPPDVTGTIAPGGSPVTVTTTTAGQNALLTFSGTAGERVSLKGTNGMTGQILGCDVNVSLVNPDGSTLVSPTCMEQSGFIDTTTLPSSGTYTILVDPVSYATGSLTLTLYDVPSDVTGAIVPGGSPVTVTMSTPGQNASLTFTGTAGQRISLRGTNGISGQIALTCDVNTSILKPDGTTLVGATCMESSGFIDATILPTSGTYTVFVNPTTYATGSLTLTLYNVPADATATTAVNGTAATVTTTTPGQNAAVTFAGTSGQAITVHLTSNTMGTVTVKLLKPDGTVQTSATSSVASFNLAQQTLAATGTYTVTVDPSGVNTGSITVGVTNP